MDRSRREAEFDQFVLGRMSSLRRTAFLVVRDWHAAEDVVQGVLIKLYVALPRLRPETLDAYARRAVVNASISHARKRTEPRRTCRPNGPRAKPKTCRCR